jgi:hypothetical protein
MVEGRPEGGCADVLCSSAAIVVTIPAWIAARSYLGFSRSAGDTLVRQV